MRLGAINNKLIFNTYINKTICDIPRLKVPNNGMSRSTAFVLEHC